MRPPADPRCALAGAPAVTPGCALTRLPLLLVAVAALCACSGLRKPSSPDNEPTLATLFARTVEVDLQRPVASTEAQAIQAYRDYLAAAPAAGQARSRAEALRRLGDLELERAEAADPASIDARTALAPALSHYQQRLQAYPRDPGNDRVLYQLARAQELSGDLGAALGTLDRLASEHPASRHWGEAQFRRGEMLFAQQRYGPAEAAYSQVLRSAGAASVERPAPAPAQTQSPAQAPAARGQPGPASPPERALRERALYMLGWSQFKQSRPAEALQALFGVLDARLLAGPDARATPQAAARTPGDTRADIDPDLAGLSRGDRELVEDTLRVTSISLASLGGATAIGPYIDRPERKAYEPRVYRELGELYLRQQRIQDAADTFAAFAGSQPQHPQAPGLLERVIAIQDEAGFTRQALQARRDYATRYGATSDFRRSRPDAWSRLAPDLQRHLDELARFHHASAQQARAAGRREAASADAEQALRWYAAFIEAFPKATQTPERHFLMAELLAEEQRLADAAEAYERVAYGYPTHARSAEAGYAAVLARRSVAGAADAAPATTASTAPAGADAQRLATATAVRFATTFPGDARATAVLTDASDRLMRQGDVEGASRVARQALGGTPGPTAEQRQVALRVLGQAAFEQRDYAAAESAFQAARQATASPGAIAAPAASARQSELDERLAAAIYRQGEAARAAGRAAEALGHFERVVAVSPGTSVAATARFDAAAVRIERRDWEGAALALEAFRREHPQHPLQSELPARLALVQLERGQWRAAALEFERLADAPSEAAVQAAGGSREAVSLSALQQAGELHERGGDLRAAARTLERQVRQHPQPLDAAQAARWRLFQLLRSDATLLAADLAASMSASTSASTSASSAASPRRPAGRSATPATPPRPQPQPASGAAPAERLQALLRDIVQADGTAASGEPRSERSHSIAGLARLELAEPQVRAYRQVALVEPLQRQLALKQQRLQAVLDTYAAVSAEAPGPELTTEVTQRTASLYLDFGRAMLASQRPRGLGAAALEQYQVMLEEQAFPFEEKAIALHEANAARASQGVYDDGVRASLAALASLKPVRWGKAEQGDAAPAGETALQRSERVAALERAARASPDDPQAWARLGLAQRQDGRFAAARSAYERSLQLRPDLAPALLNLAILKDLYLNEAKGAVELYERYASLAPAEAPTVRRWVAELNQRLARAATASGVAPSAPSARSTSGSTQAPATRPTTPPATAALTQPGATPENTR